MDSTLLFPSWNHFDRRNEWWSFVHLAGPRPSLLVVAVATVLSGLVLMTGVTAQRSANATASLPTDAEL